MEFKMYTTDWRIKNSKISILPDLGFFRGRSTIFFTWLGVTLHVKL